MKIALLLTASCLAPLPAASAPAIMAYDEGGSSSRSLQAFAGNLQSIAVDQFAIDAAGTLTGHVPASVSHVAAADGIAVLVTVSNYAKDGFSADIAHQILMPGGVQTTAIANMVKASAHSAGLNLDFEAVRRADRPLYTAFAAKLADAMHGRSKLVVLSVPAETRDNPKDSWTGAYDYAALGQSADLLQVMTYDENGPWAAPGPVAGLDWVTACLQFAQSVVPAAKISLGVPAYGYDWNLTAGGGAQIAYAAVPKLLASTGATPQWDIMSASPWFTYTAADGASHVVWYENSESVADKAALALHGRISGVSVYALGFDNADFWNAVLTGFKP